jgi:hypothetical protein
MESATPYDRQFDNQQLIKLQKASDDYYLKQANMPKQDAPMSGMSPSASADMQKYNDVRYNPANTMKDKQGGYDDRTILRTALGDEKYQQYSDNFNKSAQAGTSPQSVYDFIAGQKPSGIDTQKYSAFSDDRMAQNLPPMPPNEYMAAGQPSMPSLTRPQGIGGMGGGGIPPATLPPRFGGEIPAGKEIQTNPNNRNIDTIDWSNISPEAKQKFRDLIMNATPYNGGM